MSISNTNMVVVKLYSHCLPDFQLRQFMHCKANPRACQIGFRDGRFSLKVRYKLFGTCFMAWKAIWSLSCRMHEAKSREQGMHVTKHEAICISRAPCLPVLCFPLSPWMILRLLLQAYWGSLIVPIIILYQCCMQVFWLCQRPDGNFPDISLTRHLPQINVKLHCRDGKRQTHARIGMLIAKHIWPILRSQKQLNWKGCLPNMEYCYTAIWDISSPNWPCRKAMNSFD